MKLFNAIAIMVGALVVTAIAAIVWRAATERDMDGARATIVADYVAQCQTMTENCYALADAAIGATPRDCKRPGHRAIARGALIWFNAHPQLHPLSLEQGFTRAVDAVWPCKR